MRRRVESHIIFGDQQGQYVTMARLMRSADASRPSAQHAAGHASAATSVLAHHGSSGGSSGGAAIYDPWLASLPAVSRALARLRARHAAPGAAWRALVAAALLGANAAALYYVARRAYLAYQEQQQQQQQQEQHKAGDEQQAEITRVALAYLQRLWDVALQVRARGAALCLTHLWAHL
jgi:hypothetical protein